MKESSGSKNRNLKKRAIELSGSWGLDLIKGSGIDALAVGTAIAGPWLLPENISSHIDENGWFYFLGTYVLYLYSRYCSYKADVELQSATGVTTNAWSKSAQEIFETIVILFNKQELLKKDRTRWFQVGGEVAKFVRDELVFLVPVFLYGRLTDQTWQSLTLLNIGTIFGYVIRISLQNNPISKSALEKIRGDQNKV